MAVDNIADFLTRMRNAQMAPKREVVLPYSKLKHEIANVMLKSKFLESVEKDTSEKFPQLKITLPEKNITLTRISKCGQRIYVGAPEIRKVLNGLGISILSTSQGVMTGHEARKKNIGGELLCEIH